MSGMMGVNARYDKGICKAWPTAMIATCNMMKDSIMEHTTAHEADL